MAEPIGNLGRNVGCASGLSFSLLAEIQRRSRIVTTLLRQVFSLAPVCCCAQSWYRLFEVGTLLLYRLQERCRSCFAYPSGAKLTRGRRL